ncbi:ribosomal L1 domain-containing protein CG13096-like [Belonocnema kinseyi]|uniref:ribosomal L1 domain-containing protein CG13096-like n=1 Tax=Belonocnema kinseyi TaxID=2817044 RepID=UPI00143D94E6|nr:ribosomal L1 domain-containing protein CG13096-like [Belonocnema kinseyi]
MDVMASRVALGSGFKKEKAPKNKNKKLCKPTESVKSPSRVTKKKNLQIKEEKLKSKKEVLKETLKNVENGDSSKLYKKVAKPLKKVAKSKKTLESPQVVKMEKIKEEEITKEIKKAKNTDNKVSPKVKKQKVKNTQVITQKVKIEKGSEDPKKKIVIKKEAKKISKAPLSLQHVKKSVAAILKLAEDEVSNEVLLAEENSPIFMQVVSMKIPKTPTRQLRLLLPHTLVSPDDDVALIVKDLKRGRRRDHEPSVDHIEELLKAHKCTQIKTIIPINQLKNEYNQFELKRNLVNSYDHFLVEGKISGHVARLLGKFFTKKRKLPTSIRIGSKDLKHEIDYALSKTTMKLASNGDTHICQIGTTSMKKSEIVENIEAACNSLSINFPGKWENIRSVLIKTPKSLAIPIYITMKNKNKVVASVVQPKRPKAYRTYEGELTTVSEDASVTVTPDGVVTLKTEIESETEDEDEDEVKDEVKGEEEEN